MEFGGIAATCIFLVSFDCPGQLNTADSSVLHFRKLLACRMVEPLGLFMHVKYWSLKFSLSRSTNFDMAWSECCHLVDTFMARSAVNDLPGYLSFPGLYTSWLMTIFVYLDLLVLQALEVVYPGQPWKIPVRGRGPHISSHLQGRIIEFGL